MEQCIWYFGDEITASRRASSLNPYSNGTMYLITPSFSHPTGSCSVLILILMEQCIWYCIKNKRYENRSVLILILMEQCIWYFSVFNFKWSELWVLILILMEQCIWLVFRSDYFDDNIEGLNPYSNGTMYLINAYAYDVPRSIRVLILILMEQCIWWQK